MGRIYTTQLRNITASYVFTKDSVKMLMECAHHLFILFTWHIGNCDAIISKRTSNENSLN